MQICCNSTILIRCILVGSFLYYQIKMWKIMTRVIIIKERMQFMDIPFIWGYQFTQHLFTITRKMVSIVKCYIRLGRLSAKVPPDASLYIKSNLLMVSGRPWIESWVMISSDDNKVSEAVSSTVTQNLP